MRILTVLAMFFMAPLVFEADAHAEYSKEELKAEKEDVKHAKTSSKEVSKLAKKWHKNDEKGKDNADVEADLKQYYKDELAMLRAKGVEAKDNEPNMDHPAHREKVMEEPEEEMPKLEELRDDIVALKGGDLKDKAYGKRLDEYVVRLEARYERKAERYKEHKQDKE